MKKRTLPLGLALLFTTCLGCFSLLFLQYPIQRFFAENNFNQIQALESKLIANPNSIDDFEKLMSYVNRKPGPTKYSAIRSLGRIDATNGDEVSLLAELLTHEDHGTRRAAILAMKDQGDKAKSAMPEIIESLKDPVATDVPVFAAQILREFGADAEPALSILKTVRYDPSFSAFREDFNKTIDMIESDLVSE